MGALGTLAGARARLRALAHTDATSTDVCEAIVGAFHEVLAFDACAVMTTDPRTHLPSGGTVQGFRPEDCEPFWHNELTTADYNKFADLTRRLDPVATLAAAVDGELDRSPRYRTMYAGADVVDELRTVFCSGTSCLAVGVFVRGADAGRFTPREATVVRELVPDAMVALRQAAGRLRLDAGVRPPVMLVLDAAGHVLALSEGGRELLADLRVNGVDGELPGVVEVAAAKVRSSRTPTSLTTRLRGRSGRWLRLHVAPVEGDPGCVAIHVDEAGSDDLASILLESYGLTPRETEIVLLLCRGRSTKEIARELTISAHTVRDHLRAAYDKADVTSRGELVAQLFSNHVLDRMHGTITHLGAAPVPG